jgi:hypothetical protein
MAAMTYRLSYDSCCQPTVVQPVCNVIDQSLTLLLLLPAYRLQEVGA